MSLFPRTMLVSAYFEGFFIKGLKMTDTEQELVYCGNCNGSGEGLYNGAICYVCKGLGEVWADVEVEEDEGEEQMGILMNILGVVDDIEEDPDDYSGMGWVDDRGRP